MARYVDGFVIPIKKSKLAAYKKMAIVGRNTWMKFGALDYYECVAEDTKMPYGGTPLPLSLRPSPDPGTPGSVFQARATRPPLNKW